MDRPSESRDQPGAQDDVSRPILVPQRRRISTISLESSLPSEQRDQSRHARRYQNLILRPPVPQPPPYDDQCNGRAPESDLDLSPLDSQHPTPTSSSSSRAPQLLARDPMELYVSEDRRDELIRLGIPSSKQVSNGVIRMPTIGSASPNDVDRPNSQSDMVQSPQDTRPEQSGAFNGVNQGSTHTFDVSLRSATMRQPSVAQPATGQTILSARETQTHAPTNTDHDNRSMPPESEDMGSPGAGS